MRKIFSLALCLVLVATAMGQTIIQRDPQIAAMVGQVSADSLSSYVRSLVAS